MSDPLPRRRPFVAGGYAAAILGAHLWLQRQPPAQRAAVLSRASTNVAHLEHDPWRVLPESALWPQHFVAWWLVGIVVMVGTLEMLRGSLVTLAIASAGHLVGTLVSEGVVAVRVAVGDLGPSARHLLDVGPSYVVAACAVAVIASAVTRARWRLLVAAALAPLVVTTFIGAVSGGVAPTGHLVAAAIGLLAARGRWPRRPARTSG